METKYIKISLTKKNSGIELTSIFPDHCSLDKIEISNTKCNIYGYFIGLDGEKSSIKYIEEMCSSKNWNYFSSISAQFLLIVHFHQQGEVYAITDLQGNFPIFYSLIENEFILTPHISQLVKKSNNLSVNLHSMLQLIARTGELNKNTLFQGINYLYPGNVLKINHEFKTETFSYMMLDTMFNVDKPYDDVELFYQDFVEILSKRMKLYINAIKEQKYISDLSSGFDSSLVSYILQKTSAQQLTAISSDQKPPLQCENKQLIDSFASKHNIKLIHTTSTDITNFLELEKEYQGKYYPYPINSYSMKNHLENINKLGFSVNFTGHGGDELYGITGIKQKFEASPYLEYFHLVKKLNKGLPHIFSEKGIQTLLNRKIFSQAEYYPHHLVKSSLAINLSYFEYKWETGVWVFSPLTDINIIKFAQRIPRSNNKPLNKLQFWKQIGSRIHLDEQFVPTNEPDYHSAIVHNIEKNKNLIIETLEHGILSKTNLFNNADICKDFTNGNYQHYLEFDTIMFLIYLIKMDLYLQSFDKHIEFTYE